MESRPRAHRQGARHEATEAHTAPDGAPEALVPEALVHEVCALWSEHLAGCEVGADDDFFALGGNSLTGIAIIDRVKRDHGVELSVRDFYLAQTPARVAALIERGKALT
ncbi:acyl carrier protein [Streptomyces sp. NPDC086081]|uniref:acyl carrier protein n=1 Tax=Streptomyces sp. NPDC086081 TaxID=3365749 RepID=UPI00380D11C7